jgi:ATP-dependent RNA helicase HelY
MLARLYSDRALVVAQCLRSGMWEGLTPPELACAVSATVFVSRTDEETVPRLPKGRVRDVLADQVHTWARVESLESEFKVPNTPEPDLGFCWAAYQWADGRPLTAVLQGCGLPAGDFVRWCKQLIDALGQVAAAVPGDDPLRATATAAAESMRRGVVAYSSEI